MLHFDLSQSKRFVKTEEFELLLAQLELVNRQLLNREGAGAEFLGWLDWPLEYDKAEFARIQEAAASIRSQAEVLVVVGIGGSYLGAKAVIEALSPAFPHPSAKTLQIVYAGQQLSASYMADLLAFLEDKDVCVNVISKSGTTTEPAIAFRILKQYMERRYGVAAAAQRIFATTDKSKGALKQLAKEMGYQCFVVPDNIGGRFSVLTAVALLPIAAAGFDISALMAGAAAMRRASLSLSALEDPICQYALLRTILLRRGYKIELLANYEPSLHFISEWWKQLFGESEGKDGKGLFPASVDFSTDLHSLGQYIQDGSRILFETVLKVTKSKAQMLVPADESDLDGLNFLAGQDMTAINHKALAGTMIAHVDGAVPTSLLEMDSICEHTLGELLYFFEKACALSAYLNAVNPFNQPGVEDYKKNMFALLGKPGFEALRQELELRL